MCLLITSGRIVILTAILAFLRPSVVDAAPLRLFQDSFFKGASSEFKLGGVESCVNLRGKLNDMFSSVNLAPGDCFLICEHEFCRGRCVRVTESVSDLQLLGLNDVASSIRRCPSSPTSTSTPTSTPTSSTPTLNSNSASSSTSTPRTESTSRRSPSS